MTVSVGIPTRGDDPAALVRTVRAALRAARTAGETAEVLVVVNGRSRLPELDRIAGGRLRVHYRERRNVAAARNVVLDAAVHDTVLYVDDDCLVPPSWCVDMSRALARPDRTALCAPIRTVVSGPVSAFVDYLRLFDAIPVDETEADTLTTGNCGVRRDRLGPDLRFCEDLHTSGEDSDFGAALHEAGHRIGWLSGAPPVMHGCAEQIGEITDRYLRYGASAPELLLRRNRARVVTHRALDWYRERTRDEFRTYRRFAEFADPRVRAAFAVYEYLMISSALLGYLVRLGELTGCLLVELDRTALSRAWRDLAARIEAATRDVDWTALPVDYRRIATGASERQPALAEVRQALRTHARPVPVVPDGPAAEILARGGEQPGEYLALLERVRRVWHPIRDADPDQPAVPPSEFDRRMRAVGVSFAVAGAAAEYCALVDRIAANGTDARSPQRTSAVDVRQGAQR
ncbi:glycosyltransferase family A protein [Solwaraspora sp. WMMA2056]|uniref:glycosyltransferase n=1 Tax=Solwaraspora sp. WMMA2056 TaxID=3015161 RepID=UPI00259BB86A|nr:glycosyltransferase family A protein [Solwaraspora sp. WMMA2056]WJK38259.1 glycosyltransferase family A protein [Solwaraspora sp. WMMA2056]